MRRTEGPVTGPESVKDGVAGPRRRFPAVTALVALAALGAVVLAVLRVFGLERGWPLVPALAFTPHLLGLTALAAAGAGLLRRWVCTGVLVVVVAVLSALVVPRAVPFGVTSTGGPAVRIMTLNMLGGGADVAEVVSLVRDRGVDVLTLQEVTPGLVRDLSAAGLDGLLPHVDDHSDPRGVHGSTIHSAFPLTDLGDAAEGGDAFAMPTSAVRLSVDGDADGDADVLEVTSVHVPPPLTPSYTADWGEELDALAEGSEPGTTRVLAGDFNATLDHAGMRAVLDSGYLDAAAVLGEGLEPTWPAGRLTGLTIDHVLVDPAMGVDRLEVLEVPGTDHRAVFVEVTLPGRPR
ncbi:endonuclease/exonuclease/phosphatase (EEP) superfamily protein YafD [Nocardiopsis arvandica]|uniref:Endonuclease/exonuclease/phosphatase (EEP) superfamily protein YafD n=1 Tax=Nocardiopsis sinuspersici TaxID=501010 RepID=A0A7Y9XAM9_9ACTN|nr:endonuclease/exonuclease/phosphatase family protein [Nocardiopsis sinuspersici]NYH51492.1 endonuclease/exonuclease/phosphatase (EEP) superfamily protein YafD [Nocardiopsis sinuspersici]